jgi:hypothetical protein
MYHPGLIQPIHIALGWKRIEYSKVEKCYQQAAFIVLLILKMSVSAREVKTAFKHVS